jgi:pimeloyl-ACP methyl ester carboxylesterase
MEKHFTYLDTNITYNIYGDGDVVVLLHGFGEDSRIFSTQVETLGKISKIIVPDLPGSGKSDLLKKYDVAIDDYADCIHALLINEEVTSCKVLGHSMGGYITLSFAEKYPEILSGFGLIHSSASPDNDEKKKSRIQGINMINEYGAFSFLKNTIPNLFGSNFKKENPEKVEQLIEQSKQFANEAVIQYYTAMMNRPVRLNVLENSSVPVLFILGTEDVAAPIDMVLNQVHLPAVSRIHILNNVGHMGMLEVPVEVTGFLAEFISN